MTIQEWLNSRLEELEPYQIDNQTYYLGCMVLALLTISNITNAMGRRKPVPRISIENWTMRLIPEVNKRRGVYLFTFNGVIEIISNNHNTECKRLRRLYCQ